MGELGTETIASRRLGATWTETGWALFHAVMLAHERSACRGNVSHEMIRLAAIGSGDYSKALIAALASLGGLHAPLAATFDLVTAETAVAQARAILEAGGHLPGWGNGAVKGRPDPIWEDVECQCRLVAEDAMATVDMITGLVQARGKLVFPNPSCWTAVAGAALGFDRQTVGYLFVQGRLLAWTEAFHEIMSDDDE